MREDQSYGTIQETLGGFQPRLHACHTLARVSGMNRRKMSFMPTIGVVFALLTLASCIAAPKTEFIGPNGKMVYAISCQTIEGCETDAHKLCPDGHDVVPAASGAENTTARGGIGGEPEKKMLIQCKAP